jgi:non-specific serine/threonine protein kinase
MVQTEAFTETSQISVTPAGLLLFENTDAPEAAEPQQWLAVCATAFSRNQSAGLFVLGATQPERHLSPSLNYWREFSCLYLREICRTPESDNGQLSGFLPPPEQELEDMLANVPPMRGAEYLTMDMLIELWNGLNDWVRDEVDSSGNNLSSWLKTAAPLWHHVGRVCFHLAENKRDPSFPFAFLATYAPGVSQGGRVQYQPLAQALKEYAGERNKKGLISLLSPVYLASEQSAFVKELVDSKEIFHPLMWTPEEAYRMLKEVPLLEKSGLLVRLPDWWRKRPSPRVTMTIGDKKQSHLGLDAMLDFKVELTLGDTKLTRAEMQQILNSANDGLLYIKGQWIEVDRERLSQALAHWQRVEAEVAQSGLSFIDGMRLLAGASQNLDSYSLQASEQLCSSFNAGAWLAEVLSNLREPNSRLRSQGISKNFKGTLRSYQKTGHDWLLFLTNLGLGACLADDMGLGKTIQILALLVSIKEAAKLPRRPSLLVLPSSLLANWQAELRRFAPTLNACFVHPSQLGAQDLATMAGDPSKVIGTADLVLTTYGMLSRQQWLQNIHWRLVILDEGQCIKNPSAQQTRTVKKLKSETRIILTGTPVENRLSDLWSLFDFLLPGLLGSASQFKKFIANLNQQEHQRYAPLRNLVAPYILRRLKTDKKIITDLPDKTEMSVFCGLSKKQAALYAKSVEELEYLLKTVDGIKRRGLVLAFILRFKQICNHPSQLLGDGIYEATDSGKFDRLKSLSDEIASRQEKMLVFTQFREITDHIALFLSQIFGRSGLVLHGGTSVSKRQSMVDTFQKVDGPPFMVLTVKAGGTGLNLTQASHVVHFDRWWNPAVENQASDRAYRIGQHRNVLIHKFICQGTIEEKIDRMIADKEELADDILTGAGESLLTEMSDRELLDIVSLDLERVSIRE